MGELTTREAECLHTWDGDTEAWLSLGDIREELQFCVQALEENGMLERCPHCGETYALTKEGLYALPDDEEPTE